MPTPLTPLQFMALAASRLEPDRVATRQGLSYIEAWDAKAMLLRVFGFGGYSYTISKAEIIQIERDVPNSNGGTTNFRVTAQIVGELYIPQLEATYGGTAVASQSGSQIGEVADFALKTADSDAFKRCTINLGTQFGLSLYASDKDHVHYADVVGTVYAPGFEFQVPEKRLSAAAQFSDGNLAIEKTREPSPEAKALLQRALRVKDTDQGDDEDSLNDGPAAVLDPSIP